MGRARNQLAAGMEGFDNVFGTRRGVVEGNVLSKSPTRADRDAAAKLGAAIDKGDYTQAEALLRDNFLGLYTFPLLVELHGRMCKNIVEGAKRKHWDGAFSAMQSLGFETDENELKLLDPKLQAIMDKNLSEEARQRSLNLLKVKQPVGTAVSEAAFEKAFLTTAGAQCFQNRVALCERFLGSKTVPHALGDVTAWRSVINDLYKNPGQRTPSAVASMLGKARSMATNAEAPYRRRQRYVR